MNRASWLALGTLALTVVAACYSGPHIDPNGTSSAVTTEAPTEPTEDDGTTPADTADPAPVSAQPVCTSKTKWTRGDRGNKLMHPGMACLDCHKRDGDPGIQFAFAGTIYPTAHEPDDCYGSTDATAKVIVTDAKGKTATALANASGNYYFQGTLVPPLSAKVVSANGTTKAMKGTVPNGDCNGCHTQDGKNEAPGRITAP